MRRIPTWRRLLGVGHLRTLLVAPFLLASCTSSPSNPPDTAEVQEMISQDLSAEDRQTNSDSKVVQCPPSCLPHEECGCRAGTYCLDGECVCVPYCHWNDCADDGCGGACGPCPEGATCVEGSCQFPVCQQNCGDMLHIPAGTFMMGCNLDLDTMCHENEYPYHEVYLDAYLIDRTEVTQAAYQECIHAGACELPLDVRSETFFSPAETPDQPVAGVSAWQSDLYCSWIGKRMPTEAEWEKAARGTDGRVYPWGNSAPTCELVSMEGDGASCSPGGPLPVCSRPIGNSPYDVCDLAGNVSEWVADGYKSDYYSVSPKSNHKGPGTEMNVRVFRGGYYLSLDRGQRVSSRLGMIPNSGYGRLGFRCARDYAPNVIVTPAE